MLVGQRADSQSYVRAKAKVVRALKKNTRWISGCFFFVVQILMLEKIHHWMYIWIHVLFKRMKGKYEHLPDASKLKHIMTLHNYFWAPCIFEMRCPKKTCFHFASNPRDHRWDFAERWPPSWVFSSSTWPVLKACRKASFWRRWRSWMRIRRCMASWYSCLGGIHTAERVVVEVGGGLYYTQFHRGENRAPINGNFPSIKGGRCPIYTHLFLGNL